MNERPTLILDERDLKAADWEDALHKMFWEKGEEQLFYAIRDEALKCMKRRLRWEARRNATSQQRREHHSG